VWGGGVRRDCYVSQNFAMKKTTNCERSLAESHLNFKSRLVRHSVHQAAAPVAFSCHVYGTLNKVGYLNVQTSGRRIFFPFSLLSLVTTMGNVFGYRGQQRQSKPSVLLLALAKLISTLPLPHQNYLNCWSVAQLFLIPNSQSRADASYNYHI
jgi:hypothetical protein